MSVYSCVRRIILASLLTIVIVIIADHAFSFIIWVLIQPDDHHALDHGKWKQDRERIPLLIFGVLTANVVFGSFFSNDASKASEQGAVISRRHRAMPHEMSSVKRGKMPIYRQRGEPSNQGFRTLCYDDDDLVIDSSYHKKTELWLSEIKSPSEGSTLSNSSHSKDVLAEESRQAIHFSSTKSAESAGKRASQKSRVAQEPGMAKGGIKATVPERNQSLTRNRTAPATKYPPSDSRDHTAALEDHHSSVEGRATPVDKVVQVPRRAEDVSKSETATIVSPSSFQSPPPERDQMRTDDNAIKKTKYAERISADHGNIGAPGSNSQCGESSKEQYPAQGKTIQPTKKAENITETSRNFQKRDPSANISAKLNRQAKGQRYQAFGHCVGPSAEQNRQSASENTSDRQDEFQTPDYISEDTSSLAQSTPCPQPRPCVMDQPTSSTSYLHTESDDLQSSMLPARKEESSQHQEDSLQREESLQHQENPAQRERSSQWERALQQQEESPHREGLFHQQQSSQQQESPSQRESTLYKQESSQREDLPLVKPSITLSTAEETMSLESLREARRLYRDWLWEDTEKWQIPLTKRQFDDLVLCNKFYDQPVHDIGAITKERPILEEWARTQTRASLHPFHISGFLETFEIERLKCWLYVRNHLEGENPSPFPPGYKPVSQNRTNHYRLLAIPRKPICSPDETYHWVAKLP